MQLHDFIINTHQRLSRCFNLSRKLAVASWSYSCFSNGRGRSESNTVIFHSNPPKLPAHFEAVSEADGQAQILPGPSLCNSLVFFGSDVYDSKPKITCCSDTTLAPCASSEHDITSSPSFDQFGCGLDRILCDSDPQLRLLTPSKITILDGANTFYSSHLLWFNCLTPQSGRLRVVQMELLRNMPHQSIRLDRVLSDSGQPNFIAHPSSLVQTFQARQSF